jgi:hypothetical protein
MNIKQAIQEITRQELDARLGRLMEAGWEKGDDPDGDGEHYILHGSGLGIVTLGAVHYVDDDEINRLVSLGHAEITRRQAAVTLNLTNYNNEH